MNKYSILAPIADPALEQPVSLSDRFVNFVKKNRGFLLTVVVPTALLSAYLYLFAADQYVSEAHFVVRSAQAPAMPATGFGQFLGLTGGLAQGSNDAASVSDYLVSHDAVDALKQKVGLVERFRRPEADYISKLGSDNPAPEKLLKYYKTKVTVHTDRETGITSLQVKAFRPDDAYVIIKNLLQLGEDRVNDLNARTYTDAVSSAQRQMRDAENAVADIQSRMTSLRQTRGDLDPQVTGEAQIKLASELDGNLVAAKAQLSAMGSLISHSSPQYVALSRQVQSLEAESAQQSKVGGGANSGKATNLGAYEALRVRQEFAAKQYEAAAADLEKAREQAQKQQLYLVRIIQPNLPVKSLYPERSRIVLTVFFGLLLVYAMGWLLAAGVREHAA